jgi:hypothetical protein
MAITREEMHCTAETEKSIRIDTSPGKDLYQRYSQLGITLMPYTWDIKSQLHQQHAGSILYSRLFYSISH